MSLIALSGKIHSGKDTVAKMFQFLQLQKDYPNFWGKKTFDFFLSKDHTWEGNIEIHYFSFRLKQMVEVLTGISIKDQNDAKMHKKKLGKDYVRYFYRHKHLTIVMSPYFHTESELLNYKKDDAFITDECEIVCEELTLRDLQKIVANTLGRNGVHNELWINETFKGFKSDRYFQCNKCGTKYHQTLSFDDVREDDCPKCDECSTSTIVTIDKFKEASHWIITDLRFFDQLRAIVARDGIIIRIERDLKLRQPEVTELFEDESETALDDYDNWDYVIKNNKTLKHLLKEVKEVYNHMNLPKLN